jgi:hypothetical protein
MSANKNGNGNGNGNGSVTHSAEALAAIAARFPMHTLFWLARGTLPEAKAGALPGANSPAGDGSKPGDTPPHGGANQDSPMRDWR